MSVSLTTTVIISIVSLVASRFFFEVDVFVQFSVAAFLFRLPAFDKIYEGIFCCVHEHAVSYLEEQSDRRIEATRNSRVSRQVSSRSETSTQSS